MLENLCSDALERNSTNHGIMNRPPGNNIFYSVKINDSQVFDTLLIAALPTLAFAYLLVYENTQSAFARERPNTLPFIRGTAVKNGNIMNSRGLRMGSQRPKLTFTCRRIRDSGAFFSLS